MRHAKVLLQAEKFRSFQDHPMKAKLDGYTKNRLKRSSFVHEAKKLNREFKTELSIPTTPLGSEDIINPLANDLSSVTVRLAVPRLDRGKQEDEGIRKSLTLAMINEDYPPELWTHVYTDGSATCAVKDGAAGVFIQYTSCKRETLHATT